MITAVGRGVGKAITDTVTAIVSLIVMVSFVAAVLFLPVIWMFGIDWAANR